MTKLSLQLQELLRSEVPAIVSKLAQSLPETDGLYRVAITVRHGGSTIAANNCVSHQAHLDVPGPFTQRSTPLSSPPGTVPQLTDAQCIVLIRLANRVLERLSKLE